MEELRSFPEVLIQFPELVLTNLSIPAFSSFFHFMKYIPSGKEAMLFYEFSSGISFPDNDVSYLKAMEKNEFNICVTFYFLMIIRSAYSQKNLKSNYLLKITPFRVYSLYQH